MSASLSQLRATARLNDMNHSQLSGTANFIWVLSNCKLARHTGKVQLKDATKGFSPLRKNLGNTREAS